MNSKNIKKHLKAKLRDWTKHIDDENVVKVINENTIITGGAIVSLLTGETVHDYDVYLRTKEACITVAQYYVDKWNKEHPEKHVDLVTGEDAKRMYGDDSYVRCVIRSKGIADENEKQESSLSYNFDSTENDDVDPFDTSSDSEEDGKKEKYRSRFITSNAISLSDKIQVVTRFYGEVADIHKNYDFAHCTCAWSSWDNELLLPQKALECIINKELYYQGSKYPLCSIIRTRKYLERGYHINAGQYVKMCLQLNQLDLNDVRVLEDQLTGVDTTYFMQLIDGIKSYQKETGSSNVDTTYAIELINKLF